MKDAEKIIEAIGIDDRKRTVVVCAAFRLKKLADHVACFVFSNLEHVPGREKDKAEDMGYHVVRARAGERRGGKEGWRNGR